MMLDLVLAAVLVGAAGYRAWRIVGLDSITEPLRARLLDREGRVATFITDLILCPWCLGWWICGVLSAMVVLALGWTPLAFILLWLASSTVCGFLGGRDE